MPARGAMGDEGAVAVALGRIAADAIERLSHEAGVGPMRPGRIAARLILSSSRSDGAGGAAWSSAAKTARR